MREGLWYVHLTGGGGRGEGEGKVMKAIGYLHTSIHDC